MDVAARFSRELAHVANLPLPDGIAREAKRTLFNVLGLAVGAAGHPGVEAILGAAAELRATGLCAIPGRTERTDPRFAALATGFAAHVDDFDDTHLVTVIHSGAPILAVLVGLAPEAAASGETALRAFALGCEAELRAGVAISPEHYDRGWHITGTCGVIGASVAAALLLGADDAALARALRLATTMTLGHREAFGTMTKAFHPGKAGANGILATRLALAGADGPSRAFEGDGGFGDALSSRFDPEQMLAEIGERWELAENTYKPYPCGIVAHPAIDAALALAPRVGDLDAIAAIEVHCHPLVPELMGNPDPSDGLEARFSAIHGVAVALCDRRVGLPQYESARVIRDDVRALRAKTRLLPEPARARDEAAISVRLADGRLVEEHVVHARGSLARPLTDAELLEKVRGLVAPRLGDDAVAPITDALRRIEDAAAFDALVALTIPGVQPARV